MANFSRDTFDKLKHYVGVRLQQGVPIVDADWNEMEDIRRFELRSFLKWFVGDGIPKGNDGFKIFPVIEVKGPVIKGPVVKGPVVEGPVVKGQVIKSPVFRIPPPKNNFSIKGGTEAGPGHCLVDGWDVINERDIDYQYQRLYNNQDLANKWGVDPLEPLSPPSAGERTDLVYLDVWEREVDGEEDEELVNDKIGIETCVRRKREWVVRVNQGKSTPPAPPAGHAFYPLATLKRAADKDVIVEGDITDLRRVGLAILSKEITIKDGNVGIGTTEPGHKLHVTDTIFASNSNSDVAEHYGVKSESIGEHGVNYGVYTNAKNSDFQNCGLWAHAEGPSSLNYGVHAQVYGIKEISSNYGIYATAQGKGKTYAGYFAKGNVYICDNIGIGTTAPEYKLHVTDTIFAGNSNSDVTEHYGVKSESIGEHGVNYGVSTTAKNSDFQNCGLWALASGPSQLNYGVYAQVYGMKEVSYNYGIYATAQGKGKTYAGYFAKGNVYICDNIGIGTTYPEVKLHITGGIDVEPHQGGFLVIGSTNSANIAIDENEIMARNNTKTSILHLQAQGGDLFVQDQKNPFVIKDSGNVGIGTKEPKNKLDVSGSAVIGSGYSGSTNAPEDGLLVQGNVSIGSWGSQTEALIRGKEPHLIIGSSEKDNVVITLTDRLGVYGFNVGYNGKESYDHFYIEGFDFNGSTGKHLTISRDSGNVVIGEEDEDSNTEVEIKGVAPRLKIIGQKGNDKATIELKEDKGDYGFNLGYDGHGAAIQNHFYIESFRKEEGSNKHLTIKRNSGNVGIGTEEDDPINYKLQVAGKIQADNLNATGSDYSEYFESKNGKDIPAGTAVVIDNGKIRGAKKNEIPIGIISASPGMAGGVHVEWPKKYLRDEFGKQIMEEYQEEIMAPKIEKITKERQKMKKKKIKEKITRTEIACENGIYFQKEITETKEREVEEPVFTEVDLYDSKKENIIGKHRIPVMENYEEEIEVKDDKGNPVMIGTGKFTTKTRPKINPDYDETKEYIPREKRPEWNCVGLLGQLPLRKGQPTADSWVKIKDISKDVELWLVK